MRELAETVLAFQVGSVLIFLIVLGVELVFSRPSRRNRDTIAQASGIDWQVADRENLELAGSAESWFLRVSSARG
jgi:hypothetical protein